MNPVVVLVCCYCEECLCIVAMLRVQYIFIGAYQLIRMESCNSATFLMVG